VKEAMSLEKIVLEASGKVAAVIHVSKVYAPLNSARLLNMLPLHTRLFFYGNEIAYLTFRGALLVEKPSPNISKGDFFYWIQRRVLGIALKDITLTGRASIIGKVEESSLENLKKLRAGTPAVLRKA